MRLVARPSPNQRWPSIPAPSLVDALSDRERFVVARVADGMTDAEIGEAVKRSPETIANHLRHIYAKLGIRRRTVLVRWACHVHVARLLNAPAARS